MDATHIVDKGNRVIYFTKNMHQISVFIRKLEMPVSTTELIKLLGRDPKLDLSNLDRDGLESAVLIGNILYLVQVYKSDMKFTESTKPLLIGLESFNLSGIETDLNWEIIPLNLQKEIFGLIEIMP